MYSFHLKGERIYSHFHDCHSGTLLRHSVSPKSALSGQIRIWIWIYDVPMKFAHKLTHGGPVHHCSGIKMGFSQKV